MKKKSIFKYLPLICLTASLLIYPGKTLAVDIQLEAHIVSDNNLGMTLHSEKHFSKAKTSNNEKEKIGTFKIDPSKNYLSFVDNTDTPGFFITLEIADLKYTGKVSGQESISATNIEVILNEEKNNAKAASKGYNNIDYNLNILPESCKDAKIDKFIFHEDFNNKAKNYSLKGSKSAQVILSSTTDCLTTGELRIDKVNIIFPQGSVAGEYETTFIYTIFDGPAPK